MRKYENIFLLCLLAVAGLVFAGSMNVRSFLSEPVTAASYGMLVSGLFALSCVWKLIQNIREASAGKESKAIKISYPKLLIGMTVSILLYSFGITKVGYFTSTFLFLLVMLLMLSEERKAKDIGKFAVFSLIFNVALYYLFQVMSVYMPNTPLI